MQARPHPSPDNPPPERHLCDIVRPGLPGSRKLAQLVAALKTRDVVM